MTFSYEQGVAWAQTRAYDLWAPGTADGRCEALMYRMLGASTPTNVDASTATDKSTIVSRDPYAAPAGTFHHWDISGVPDGHIGVGAGNGLIIMASRRVNPNWQGVDVGTIDFDEWQRQLQGRSIYLGWSYDHAGYTFSNVSAAAGGVEGFDNTSPKDKHEMARLLECVDGPWAGLGFFLTEDGRISCSRDQYDDLAWQDTYGAAERGPFDKTYQDRFLRTCNALGIPFQAIEDAVANKGIVYPKRSSSVVLVAADREAITAGIVKELRGGGAGDVGPVVGAPNPLSEAVIAAIGAAAAKATAAELSKRLTA